MERETEVIKLTLASPREEELLLPLEENLKLYCVDNFENLKQIWSDKDWFGLKVCGLEIVSALVENPSEVKTDFHWKIKCFQSRMYPGDYWQDRKALFACWYTYEFGGSSGINKFDNSCTVPR